MIKLCDNIAWTEVENQYLLVNYQTEKVIICEGTGLLMTKGLIEQKQLDVIVNDLSRQFSEDKTVVWIDLVEYVAMLVKAGYFEIVNEDDL